MFGAGHEGGTCLQSTASLKAQTKPVLKKENSVRLVQLVLSFIKEKHFEHLFFAIAFQMLFAERMMSDRNSFNCKPHFMLCGDY